MIVSGSALTHTALVPPVPAVRALPRRLLGDEEFHRDAVDIRILGKERALNG